MSLVVATLGCIGACKRSENPQPIRQPADEAPTAQASARWAPYPPGRWRLASPKELEPVVIWTSHILVRYAGAADEESFSFAFWGSVPPPVARSREEALVRAREIAEQARRRPERFAELASAHSEDITNREHGGSLGGLRASQLMFWPQVLDAFAGIRPGEVSEPVETRFGFHVFLREPPPADEMISGRHIVISHERVKWAGMTTCKDALPRRTREEALSLSNTIFAALKARPESFDDAVQRYSEDCDVASGGDFGSWSTREVAPLERRLDVLRRLAPGEAAPPRETHVGFEIIVRTPERPRPHFAAELISIPFNPWAADTEPNSRGQVLAKALETVRVVQQQPARFAEFQNTYCCAQPSVWEEGREPPGLRAVLTTLKPGELSPEPVRTPAAYMLVRKLDSDEVALPPRVMAAIELPSPERISLQAVLTSASIDVSSEALSRLSRESAKALGLSPDVTRKLAALLGDWAATSAGLEPERRAELLEMALEESRALLQDELYMRYRAGLEASLAGSILAQPRPMF